VNSAWTEAELAYFAGILDGEGCFGISRCVKRGHPAYHTRVSVTNTSAQLMRWLLDHFGGAVCLRSKTQHSNPNANPLRWKPSFEWKCADKAVAEFLPLVLPYLVIKREQATLVIEYRKTVLRKGGEKPLPAGIVQHRDQLKSRLSLLNKKGA